MEKLLREGLVGIMRWGVDSVPNGLADLRQYLVGVHRMLAEKAEEHESSPELMLTAGAEVEVLLDLEQAIVRKAGEVPASSVPAVLEKLAIWELFAQGDNEESALGNALVQSAISDLRRLGHPAPALS